MAAHIKKIILLLFISLILILFSPSEAKAQGLPRVHIPYFSNSVDLGRSAIFWYGKVAPVDNYSDVRIGYTDSNLVVNVSVFDKILTYNPEPLSGDLTNWDAVSVALKTDTGKLYKFTGQLNWWESRDNFQKAYAYNSGAWQEQPISFTTQTTWRGDAPNNSADDRCWQITFTIPFTSLGYSAAPLPSAEWRMHAVTYDRDEDTMGPSYTWPEASLENSFDSWGYASFSIPTIGTITATNLQTALLRNGLYNLEALDADVGGHFNCGEDYNPDFFNGWGNANYSGFDQMNIQNQIDVADWPCYSKYYITFPLSSIPQGKVITGAKFTLHMFGNSGASGEAKSSFVQLGMADTDFIETSVTWNNAPHLLENISYTLVDPITAFPGWPGVAYNFDATSAVSRAYKSGSSLTLVLYDPDTDYHSGKYFTTSDAGEWDAAGRPALEITYGDPVSVSPTPDLLSADANGDRKINALDFGIWFKHYLNSTVNGTTDGDFNNDQHVDGLDYQMWLNSYGLY